MSATYRQTNYKKLTTIGHFDMWQFKGAPDQAPSFFESSLSVDADGAPKAYGPHGTTGTLDNLGNAGSPGSWYGIVTDKHKNPVVQSGKGPDQPHAGFYISPTSLHNHQFPESDVRRWADATAVPYVALPPHHVAKTGFKLGDIALVVNTRNGKFVFAVFADAKSDSKKYATLGEFSIATCAAIGAPTDARHGGLSNGIITVLFPGSGKGQGSIPAAAAIQSTGRSTLQQLSGKDSGKLLAKAFPEHPLFEKALTTAGY